MEALIRWVQTQENLLPCPILAAISHYQFATIHPYYDGNGRTARLLTTFLLHQGGYSLKGLFSLEEYYARNLQAYYDAISIGPSHNYYLGRAGSDITKWVEYFCEGMADSFEKVHGAAIIAAKLGEKDQSLSFRELDPKQRKVLTLFQNQKTITAKAISELFGFKPKTCSNLCRKWVDDHFLIVVDPSKKGRKYELSGRFEHLI